jgi:Ricin-type beta-trefoil lectin domain
MRGIRGLAVFTAVIGLLTAGAVTASMEVAHADTPDSCIGASDSTVAFQCALSANINNPSTVTITVTDESANAYDEVNVNWTAQCTDNNNGELGTAGAPTSATPVTVNLTLPASADGTCSIAATVTLEPPSVPPNGATPPNCVTPTAEPTATATTTATPTSTPTPPCGTEFRAVLSDTSASNPTASASSSTTSATVNEVKGYGGKCLDDKGNSSSNRAEVIIWGCNGSDQAQNWSASNGELVHNGKCLNDQGNGGNRSKVILWSCNGGANEKWTAESNGELKLQSHGGAYCLDDPGYSTKNGTQLIIYTCKDSSNQKWSNA